MADTWVAGRGMQTVAGKPYDYPGIEVVELNDFELSTFLGEEELRDKRNCNL